MVKFLPVNTINNLPIVSGYEYDGDIDTLGSNQGEKLFALAKRLKSLMKTNILSVVWKDRHGLFHVEYLFDMKIQKIKNYEETDLHIVVSIAKPSATQGYFIIEGRKTIEVILARALIFGVIEVEKTTKANREILVVQRAVEKPARENRYRKGK